MTTASFLEDIMRLSFRTIAACGLALIASLNLAPAAEVRVLSVGSTQTAAKAIAAEFEKETGHKVIFTIRPPFNIDRELAEKTFDAVILSVPAMDNHDEAAGDLTPMSRVALARVGVGVVVKEGRPIPDVSTPDKLKAAVLAARRRSSSPLRPTYGPVRVSDFQHGLSPVTRFVGLIPGALRTVEKGNLGSQLLYDGAAEGFEILCDEDERTRSADNLVAIIFFQPPGGLVCATG